VSNSNSMTENYSSTFVLNKSPREVFNAIINVKGWWQDTLDGETANVNDEFIFHNKYVHKRLKVIEVVPDRKIVWLVTYSYLAFVKGKNKSEWTGTKILVEIIEEGDHTKLIFTHAGLVPKFECYGDCSEGWNHYLKNSLVKLINTGKGAPYMEESKRANNSSTN